MLSVVFVRKLREGKTSSDFRDAWYPEVGFGVRARVLSGGALDDPRTTVTVGFLDADPADLADLADRLAAAEAGRHERIDAVIESTAIGTFFHGDGDDDLSAAPRPLDSSDQGFPWISAPPS